MISEHTFKENVTIVLNASYETIGKIDVSTVSNGIRYELLPTQSDQKIRTTTKMTRGCFIYKTSEKHLNTILYPVCLNTYIVYNVIQHNEEHLNDWLWFSLIKSFTRDQWFKVLKNTVTLISVPYICTFNASCIMNVHCTVWSVWIANLYNRFIYKYQSTKGVYQSYAMIEYNAAEYFCHSNKSNYHGAIFIPPVALFRMWP